MPEVQVRTEPWLTEGAIEFLSHYLQPGMLVLEFGTGASTYWFANRGAIVESYESDKNWQTIIRELTSVVSPICVLHDWTPDTPKNLSTHYQPGTFDLVLIDGEERRKCLLNSIPLVKPGGVLMVDNMDWWAAEPFAQHVHKLLCDWNYTVSSQRRPDKFGFVYSGWSTAWWQKPPERPVKGEFLTGNY